MFVNYKLLELDDFFRPILMVLKDKIFVRIAFTESVWRASKFVFDFARAFLLNVGQERVSG